MKSAEIKNLPADATEKDSIDDVPIPRLNPWVAFSLVVLAHIAYVMIWAKLLGG